VRANVDGNKNRGCDSLNECGEGDRGISNDIGNNVMAFNEVRKGKGQRRIERDPTIRRDN